MKAAKKFKRLVHPSKADQAMQSILGDEYEAHFVEPPMEMDDSEDFPSVGLDANAPGGPNPGLRKLIGRHPMLARSDSAAECSGYSEGSISSRPDHSPSSSRWASGVFEPECKDSGSRSGRSPGKDFPHSQSASPHPALSRASSAMTKRSVEGTRGHARDPLEEDFPYLFIGPSTYTGSTEHDSLAEDSAPLFAEPESTDADPDLNLDPDEPMPIVSESPGAAEFDIYETAYRQELERIETTTPGAGPKVYLTRRVRNTHDVLNFVKNKALDLQIGQRKAMSTLPQSSGRFSAAVSMLRSQMEYVEGEQKKEGNQEQRPEEETTTRRSSYPPSSSLSSSGPSNPEASLNEATGTPGSRSSAGGEDSLRRLIARGRDNDK
jgi:[calcium/calmodulin-dependent protein kinase] kinase